MHGKTFFDKIFFYFILYDNSSIAHVALLVCASHPKV
jgi:hypothetical protein